MWLNESLKEPAYGVFDSLLGPVTIFCRARPPVNSVPLTLRGPFLVLTGFVQSVHDPLCPDKAELVDEVEPEPIHWRQFAGGFSCPERRDDDREGKCQGGPMASRLPRRYEVCCRGRH